MEEQIEYIAGSYNNRRITQSYTVNLEHVAMLSDLVNRGFHRNASEAVRAAIEAYYQSCNEASQERPK